MKNIIKQKKDIPKKPPIMIDPNPIRKFELIDKDGVKIFGDSRAAVMQKRLDRRTRGEII